MTLDRTQSRHDEIGSCSANVGDQPPTCATSNAPIVTDLCCGLGGLSLASRQLGMSIAAGVDLTEDALRTFAKNFPEADQIQETVTGKKVVACCLEAIQQRRAAEQELIVVSGPPCQGFSVAGPRNPKDKRNKVFLGVARTISSLEPKCALVENVQMLLADQHAGRVNHFEEHLEPVRHIFKGREY